MSFEKRGTGQIFPRFSDGELGLAKTAIPIFGNHIWCGRRCSQVGSGILPPGLNEILQGEVGSLLRRGKVESLKGARRVRDTWPGRALTSSLRRTLRGDRSDLSCGFAG